MPNLADETYELGFDMARTAGYLPYGVGPRSAGVVHEHTKVIRKSSRLSAGGIDDVSG